MNVTIKHVDLGETRTLEAQDVNPKVGTVYVRWPMGTSLVFSAKTGYGRGKAERWVLSAESLAEVRAWIKRREFELAELRKAQVS